MAKEKYIRAIRKPNGGYEDHRLVVFLINTKHPDGTPALCTLLKDEQKVDLAGGEEFMTAFVPVVMVKD